VAAHANDSLVGSRTRLRAILVGGIKW